MCTALLADGSPSRIWTSHEDIVYALAFDSHDNLLAGTGNRGHVFAIDGQDEFSDLLKAPASQVTGFAKAPGGGLYAASSNLGKIFVLGPGPESEGTYESDVFDAKVFSRWGRAEFRGAGNVDVAGAQRQRRQSRPQLESLEASGSRTKILKWEFLPRAMPSGKPCCTPETPSPRSTPSP